MVRQNTKCFALGTQALKRPGGEQNSSKFRGHIMLLIAESLQTIHFCCNGFTFSPFLLRIFHNLIYGYRILDTFRTVSVHVFSKSQNHKVSIRTYIVKIPLIHVRTCINIKSCPRQDFKVHVHCMVHLSGHSRMQAYIVLRIQIELRFGHKLK